MQTSEQTKWSSTPSDMVCDSGSGSGLRQGSGYKSQDSRAFNNQCMVECSAVQAAKPIPTPTGARPSDGASAKAPLLPLSILRVPLAAKEVQGTRLHPSLYFLC